MTQEPPSRATQQNHDEPSRAKSVVNAEIARFIRFYESPRGHQILRKEAVYLDHELLGCDAILDVGCGIGAFEQQLPALNIVGVDVSEAMVNEARRRSTKTFLRGDATSLPFQEETFDAVFTVTTLEFIEDYQRAVREMARVTRPQGRLVVMMLNPHSDYFRDNVQRPGGYFQRVRQTNLAAVREYIAHFYTIQKRAFFLRIQGDHVGETTEEAQAALYVVVADKKPGD